MSTASLSRLATVLLFGFAASFPLKVSAAASAPSVKTAEALHDFDFFHGSWKVHNHRMVGRLVNSQKWEDFEAVVECHDFPGGVGNEDSYITDFWPGFTGISVRFFNRSTQKWAIYWASNKTGVLEPPVLGSFDAGGVGIFEGDDVEAGKPVRVRYTWSRTRTTTPRWEQAYSADAGKTWETNWVMDFERTAAAKGAAP
jgi:hypothetical protein